jgi:hypothetical protein
MRWSAATEKIGRVGGRYSSAASIGMVVLCAALLATVSVLPAFADTPAQVTLDGTWELARQDLATCTIAVPPVIGGTIHLEADFVDGTISGSFEGSGEGSQTLPGGGVCDLGVPETWYGEMSMIEGSFAGPLDRVTGHFDLDFDFTTEAWGYKEAPGISWRCGTKEFTPTCPMEAWENQEGTISGTIKPDGHVVGDLDLYTFDEVFCETVYPTRDAWGEDCPTLGAWGADVTDVVWQPNEAPEVSGITASPQEPTTDDSVVFSVVASDPDGDDLTYAWYVDGTREGPSAPSVTWGKPTAGDHSIKVTVSDGGDTADAFLDIRVSEHVGAGDGDDDGVPDDEDLCPTEWGSGDDGCPPFAATIGCAPARPLPEEAVVCSATVAGTHVGETLSFDWYLDGGTVQTGASAVWTWSSSESGTHDVGLRVVGEGRSFDSNVTLEVGGGLVDEETAGFHIVSVGCNSGVSSDDTLRCSTTFERDRDDIGPLVVTWRIGFAPPDSEAVPGNSATWAVAQPAPGDYTVLLNVTDPATNYTVGRMTAGDVAPGKNAMVPPAAQAGAAVASTLTAAGWLWLEWARRKQEASGVASVPVAEDDQNRMERAAALREHQRFADEQWEKFTRRCRQVAAAEFAAGEREKQDRQLRMLKVDRLEEIAQREGHTDVVDFLDRQLQEGVLPSWRQLQQVRDGIVRRGDDQAAMSRYFEKSDVRFFLEGCHDTVAWETGKVAGAMVGQTGGRLAEWMVRNPEVPIRIGLAGLTFGKSELALIPVDAWRAMDAAADQKMAEQNLELTGWEATKEVIKTGAWYVTGEVVGDAVSKLWTGGGAVRREAVEEVGEAAAGRAGSETVDDFVRRIEAEAVERRAVREAGERGGGLTRRLPDDYLRNFAREGDVVPLNHMHETGYTFRDSKAAGRICADEGVEIYARTTNMESMRHIRDGTALPKSLDIKAKTINELDTYLGAKPEDKGLVGFFEPVEPDLSKVPTGLREEVNERFVGRMDEFAKYSKDAKFQGLLEKRVLEVEGGKILDVATGKPFAGDIDAVFIKDKATGKYLVDGPRYERVIRRWKAEVGGQHGVEMNVVSDITAPYRPGTPEYDKAYAAATDLRTKLQESHRSGKEVVVRFDADGVVRRGPRDIDLTPSPDQILRETAEPPRTGGAAGSAIGREWEGQPDA